MTKPFQGKINLDVRDSTPDWGPYEQPKAPDGAPNVLYIVWDDVGFGAFETFGGLIETPNMQRISDQGLRYAQFHTTALCSPTRSCLMTGRNATSNGMAAIIEATTGFPGSNGRIPFEHGFLSEALVERGWNTYAVGKWHIAPEEEGNLASSRRLWPLGRGFERFYGFLGGETDQWYPDLVEDNHQVEPPATPKEGYHLSKDLADHAMSFIRDSKSIAPDKPWMMYFCPGAAHAPHQVFKEWADRYRGRFSMGYEAYRRLVLANQKRMGLIPQNTELPPLNPCADVTSADGKPWPENDIVRPWESLSQDEQRLFCRMAEVYAGFISYTDHQIGRLLDYLEASGQRENTIIVALSDNGASGEGGPNGSVNENKFFNGVPDTIEENIKYLEVLGSELTYNHYPNGWAVGFCTPFKYYKRYANFEGGTADPFIISWPKGIKARGEVRQQYIHAIDIVPTLYDCLGIEPPSVLKGFTQRPLEGASFRATFDDPKAATPRPTQFYSMLGTRGIWHEGWHASTIHPPCPSDWGQFVRDRWELFNLAEDRNQCHNLADTYPEKLEELKGLWFAEAGKYNGLPLEDRSAVEILTLPRPQLTPARDRYIYYPNCSEIPEAVAVSIRGRSFNIAAEVEVESANAQGVLFSQGGRFGGHSLYIKGGKLHYTYNWLGQEEQKLSSRTKISTGKCILGIRFRMEGREGPNPVGMVALYVNDQNVGEQKMKMQPGKFTLGGEGLNVGRDSGQPVSSDYQAPFSFTGGTIAQVIVDVSEVKFRDLEKELQAMYARD